MQAASCARGRFAVRLAIALTVVVVAMGTIAPAPADTTGGFEDKFNAPHGTLLINHGTTNAQPNWVVDPPVFATSWVIETRPTAVNAALGTMSVLVNRSTSPAPNDPTAFVNRNLSSFVFQVQAAYDKTVPNNSGVGIVFRAPIDPNTGAIDRKNLYLLTAVNAAPNPRTFPTGHAFMIFKRVAGAFYMAAPPVNTWLDFSNTKFHSYKVSMVGERIQAWVDGLKIFDLVDSPGSDQVTPTSPYKMPGPAFVAGAVGVRASLARAVFDDIVVSGSPAYEGRATALNMYGQVGYESGLNTQQGAVPAGVEQGASGGDTGFQYHDHDFNSAVNGPITSPTGGTLAAAAVYTQGMPNGDGLEQVTSAAQLAGFAGVFADPNGRTMVSLTAELIRATASATCQGTASTVDVVNLTWEVVYKDANGNVVTTQGSTTKFNAVPNTNLLDPRHQTGPLPQGPNGLDPNATVEAIPVRITLHSRATTNEPQRMEAAGIRITFLSRAQADSRVQPTNVVADVAVANVVAGKLCS